MVLSRSFISAKIYQQSYETLPISLSGRCHIFPCWYQISEQFVFFLFAKNVVCDLSNVVLVSYYVPPCPYLLWLYYFIHLHSWFDYIYRMKIVQENPMFNHPISVKSEFSSSFTVILCPRRTCWNCALVVPSPTSRIVPKHHCKGHLGRGHTI